MHRNGWVEERRDMETLPRSVASELGHGLLGKKAKIFFKVFLNPHMSQASSAE